MVHLENDHEVDLLPIPHRIRLSSRPVPASWGVAIALCLALLGAFALYKYIGAAGSEFSSTSSVASSGGSEPATVTVTLSGGHVSTIPKPGSSRATPTVSSTSSTSSSGNGTIGLTLSGVSKNNIGIGFLPDYNGQTMSDITSGPEIKSSFYGCYQKRGIGTAQLMSQMSDIKSCSCIFQPAVMPTTGWTGLTSSDNSQALAIAKVMQQFTNEGIEVWLRFAHEVNYYQTDGTYQGTADDFKEGWAAVAAAVADNDLVKMFFTPNVASSLDDYLAYMLNDTSTIDYIGIGTYYYPKDSSQSFTDTMQGLYDQHCKDGTIKFAIGETGLGWNGTIDERLAWLAQITSEATAAAMPNFVGVSWFNYLKGEDFRLWIPGDSSANSASQAWFVNGTVASGGDRLGGDCAAEAEEYRKAAENDGQGRLDWNGGLVVDVDSSSAGGWLVCMLLPTWHISRLFESTNGHSTRSPH
ncbi:hypothetical protein JCM1841_006936 [Sporobolomyces salmonicolor]